jgi:hypothetical protein
MPYIPQDRREDLDPNAYMIYGADTTGELTYQLTELVLRYLGEFPQFRDYSSAIAALECAKLELYRRSVAPYETNAAFVNGDLDYPAVDRG